VLLVLSVQGPSHAVEVTITFDGVSVSSLETETLSNRSLHALSSSEPTAAGEPVPPAKGSSADLRSTAPLRGASEDRAVSSAPGVLRQSTGRLVPPPGDGLFNPSFIENGFLVESFWAIDTGRPNGHFIRGHFHPQHLETGFEAQHFGNPRELHGIFIRALDRRPFNLKSLAYRVTHNRELAGRSRSLVGFSHHDVKVLIATEFSPTGTVLGQFIPFPVGPPISNDPTVPFEILPIGGFSDVTQVFIASSASVDFDDIVIEVEE
jgi:hypothetical protein